MRTRLRPVHSPEHLRALYPQPHDHRKYGRGHGERVEETIRLGKLLPDLKSVADLSCGNAEIARAMHPEPVLGDLAAGYALQGPIEETLALIPPVDLFVCCETLEHLDDPDAVLKEIRKKARFLLVSTPIDNFEDTNDEHYWAWNRLSVEFMLLRSGFAVKHSSEVDARVYGEVYCYGIWLCE